MTNQALRISTTNYQPVRVLSQENPRAIFKVTRVPPTPGKKALIYWVYDIGFIQNVPWDLGEWHWLPNPPLGDAPFFGYLAKRGYTNIRKSMQTSSMAIFLNNFNLRNTSTTQLTARI
jgi:amino acid transporter